MSVSRRSARSAPPCTAAGARRGVRPYRPADRDAVRRICCDTGFLGEPVEHLLRDRELFADLMTGPYLDHEPDWAWVAEEDGAVVGYLLGSVSPANGGIQLRIGAQTFGRLVGRWLRGRYAGHPASRRYLGWLLFRSWRERPRRPENAAHLHFNLLPGARGRWFGLSLWQRFERQLLSAGVETVYGEFFSFAGHRPETIYARYGFSVYDRRETTLFRAAIAEPVEIVCALCPVTAAPASG